MDWDITSGYDGVVVGKFGSHGLYQDGSERFITGLLPGRINKEYPVGETISHAKKILFNHGSLLFTR